jgi:hypothetical protein
MPRLVAVEELSPVQNIWLYSSYEHHRGEASFNDSAEGIIENDVHDIPAASVGGYGHLTQATPSPEVIGSNHRIDHHNEYIQHSDSYAMSFLPPRKLDNRSSIFRERDGRPPVRNEYENYGYYQFTNQYNHHYYYQHDHHHYHQHQFYPPSDPSSFSEEQRQDASPPRVDRKRDRSLESRGDGIDARGCDMGHHDTAYYHSPYVYRQHAHSSVLPFFEPEETPNRKRQFIAPTSPTWNKTKEHEPTAKKSNPVYPHQGDKLTWQQSYENLQLYKQTYGVSTLNLLLDFGLLGCTKDAKTTKLTDAFISHFIF